MCWCSQAPPDGGGRLSLCPSDSGQDSSSHLQFGRHGFLSSHSRSNSFILLYFNHFFFDLSVHTLTLRTNANPLLFHRFSVSTNLKQYSVFTCVLKLWQRHCFLWKCQEQRFLQTTKTETVIWSRSQDLGRIPGHQALWCSQDQTFTQPSAPRTGRHLVNTREI